MLAEVRRNWFVPYSVAFNHGHVAVGISVARDGTVTELKVLFPSGISGFDNAAVGALRASQLLPLPADYPDDKFDIILVFWYNERPYDLFG
jgi:TonB family protein